MNGNGLRQSSVRRVRGPGFSIAAFASMLVGPVPAHGQDLAMAIAEALANAPAVAGAEAGATAARARLDAARAQSNPLLGVEGSFGAGRIDNGGFFGITADDTTPLALQAIAQLPLYAGGRISGGIEQAKGGALLAQAQLSQSRLQTVVRAVSAYAQVLASRQIEVASLHARDELSEVERQARLRFKAGEIASSDLAQARTRHAQAQAGYARASGRRQSAEAVFERITGKRAGDLAPFPDLPPRPATLAEALDLARTHNPVVRQAAAHVAIAQAGARSARAEGMPSVGAFAEAAHVRDQFFPDYRADSVSVGVRGRWTVFSGGRVGAQVRAADANVTAAEAAERDFLLAVDGMVIDAWVGLETAQRALAAARLQSDAAAEALRGTRLEAQVGSKPTLAVLDATREALDGETARIDAEGKLHIAAWQLNALVGGVE